MSEPVSEQTSAFEHALAAEHILIDAQDPGDVAEAQAHALVALALHLTGPGAGEAVLEAPETFPEVQGHGVPFTMRLDRIRTAPDDWLSLCYGRRTDDGVLHEYFRLDQAVIDTLGDPAQIVITITRAIP